LDLLHLRYFATVAEEMSIRRAAERLRVAQPGLSQRIKTLERTLGVRLFTRDGRRIRLTADGSVLLPLVRGALAEVDRVAQAASELKRGSNARLAFAYSHVVCPSMSFRLMANFRRRHPAVAFEAHAGFTSSNIDQVRRGEIDVAFVCLPLDDDNELEVAVLVKDPIVVAMSRGHAFASRRRIDPSDLRDQPLVFFPRRLAPGFHDMLLDCVYGPGQRPGAMAVEPDERYVLAAVAAGDALTVLPRSTIGLGVPGIAVRRLVDPEPTAPIGIAWRRANPNPALRAFLSFVRVEARCGQGARG
jgi:DNA-binding transcriptional LysR family regulator